MIATIAPVFGLIALGFVAARCKWLSATAGKGLSEFTFLIAIPALLFRAIVVADLGEAEPSALLASYFTTVAMIWAIATGIAVLLLARPAGETVVFAMTASYGNIVLLGIPIVIAAYGEDVTPTAAVIVSVHVAALWLAACLHLAVVDGRHTGSFAGVIRSVVIDFVRNPIVVAIVLGAAWRATGLGLGAPVERGLSLLAQAGIPCALFAVGFSLSGFRLGGDVSVLFAALVLKNMMMPALAWAMTFHVFGLPVLPATVITVFAAMPTGTATYLFASRYDLAVPTSSASVALSTFAAMITLPIVLLLLAQP